MSWSPDQENHEDGAEEGEGDSPLSISPSPPATGGGDMGENDNDLSDPSPIQMTPIGGSEVSEELSTIRDFQRAMMDKKSASSKKSKKAGEASHSTTTTLTTRNQAKNKKKKSSTSESTTGGGGNGKKASKLSKTKSSKSSKPSKPSKSSKLSSKLSSKRAGSSSDSTEVQEVANYVVIRNDHGAAHLFRQYSITGIPDCDEHQKRTTASKAVQIHGLTSVRYVEPSSTLVMGASTSNPSLEPEELQLKGGQAVTLDGPLYRPLSSSSTAVTFVGKQAEVINASGGIEVSGRITHLYADRLVDLWNNDTQSYNRVRYDRINLLEEEKGDTTDMWNRTLQTLTIPVPIHVDQIYLHYQLRSGCLTWDPQYRALIHPSFQYLISLQCKADIVNDTEEYLAVQQVRLQMVRKPPAVNVYRGVMMNESRSLMAAPASMAFPSHEADTKKQAEPMLQEFSVTLPQNQLPPQRSCAVHLFTVERVPIVSWYETDVISMSTETVDTPHLTFDPIAWYLKILNIHIRTDTSVLNTAAMAMAAAFEKKKKNKRSNNDPSSSAVHWPAGPLQLLLPASLQSDHIQPDQIQWLTKTVIPSVAKGESTTVSLPSPWSLSTQTRVEIQKTPIPVKEEKDWLAFQVVSRISIRVRHLDRIVSRFPLRLKLEMDSSSHGIQVSFVRPPFWTTPNRSGQPTAVDASVTTTMTTSVEQRQPPVQVTKEGRYWIIHVVQLPDHFESTLIVEVTWTEVQAKTAGGRGGRKRHGGVTDANDEHELDVSVSRSGGGGGGGGANSTTTTSAGAGVESTMINLQDLTPTSIPLPVPVPDDVSVDADEP